MPKKTSRRSKGSRGSRGSRRSKGSRRSVPRWSKRSRRSRSRRSSSRSYIRRINTPYIRKYGRDLFIKNVCSIMNMQQCGHGNVEVTMDTKHGKQTIILPENICQVQNGKCGLQSKNPYLVHIAWIIGLLKYSPIDAASKAKLAQYIVKLVIHRYKKQQVLSSQEIKSLAQAARVGESVIRDIQDVIVRDEIEKGDAPSFVSGGPSRPTYPYLSKSRSNMNQELYDLNKMMGINDLAMDVELLPKPKSNYLDLDVDILPKPRLGQFKQSDRPPPINPHYQAPLVSRMIDSRAQNRQALDRLQARQAGYIPRQAPPRPPRPRGDLQRAINRLQAPPRPPPRQSSASPFDGLGWDAAMSFFNR